MKKEEEKTNVIRIIEQHKAQYIYHTFPAEHALSGQEAAKALNMPVEKVFKTLVTVSKSNKNYVFVIPAACELNLKKAAAVVGEKSVEMLKQANLLPLTGYVHGGCSPIGMKKFFTTVVDSSAKSQSTIVFSAGKIGHQVEMAPSELKKVIDFSFADVIN